MTSAELKTDESSAVAVDSSMAVSSDAEKMAVVEAGFRKLCSDVTLVSGKDGFFKTVDRQVIEKMTEDQFEEFSKLTSNEERVYFVWNLPIVHSLLKVKRSHREKSKQSAERSKKDGNTQFQLKRYKAAVNLYSQTVALAPPGELLALGFANRSAALFHLERFPEALDDIHMALSEGYPSKLLYKLFDRQALCLLKLGEVSKARESLQQLLLALDESSMESDKLDSWRESTITRIDQIAGKEDFTLITKSKSCEKTLPPLPSSNPRFPSASGAVEVRYTEDLGRHAVATAPVSTGEVMVVERAYACVIVDAKLGTHCSNCLKRVFAAFPCPRCSGVVFCSSSCFRQAEFHRWECQIQLTLTASGMSPLSRLALRMITKKNVEFFSGIKSRLEKYEVDRACLPNAGDDSEVFDPSSYLSIMQLVTLSGQRSPADMFHRALMAVFLLKTLRTSGFFKNQPDFCDGDNTAQLGDMEVFIGGLLLRHLQLLQFNAHEVGEFVMMYPNHFKQCRSVNVGVAVYPTVSFFNHDCTGGVARTFVGDTMIIRAVGPLSAGDHIPENYGPVFTHKSLEDRQQSLKSRYWFKCQCKACVENWPDYDQMEKTNVRFRCQACAAVLPSDDNEKAVSVQCETCQHKNNMPKLCRDLESSLEIYRSGMHMMDDGEAERALRVFYRFVEQCHRLVEPPYRELSLCQEAIRMCLASTGSQHVIKTN